VIVSSGGVSVGEEDHVKAALEAIGKLDLWKISVKPGKPLAFGHINTTTFFGLPGNPVSAFVTFLLFVKPYLLKAQGASNVAPQLIEVIADFDWPPVRAGKQRKPITREEYLRARLKEDGRTVEIYPNQSSGALSSVTWANGLAIAPVGGVISRGDKVKFLFVE
jgi:molybdopterin molybdotransferase